MPTYEFRCPDGTVIERIFKMSEVPDTIPSPNGDGDAVRMISGGAGLVFKGSGFYITDYGKDGKKDQRDAAKSTESTKTTVPAAAPAASAPAPAAAPATSSSSTPSAS